jgi:hypothetical protein
MSRIGNTSGIGIDFELRVSGITTKTTRLPPSDFDFRKRPIGNSGAFFGSSGFFGSQFCDCIFEGWPNRMVTMFLK